MHSVTNYENNDSFYFMISVSCTDSGASFSDDLFFIKAVDTTKKKTF